MTHLGVSAKSGSRGVADVQELFAAAVRAVSPEVLFGGLELEGLTMRPLSAYSSVRLVAIGKAALGMAKACASALPRTPDSIVVVLPETYRQTVARQFDISMLFAGHPVPDQGSIAAANEIARVAGLAHEADLLIVLLSGGGSALIGSPRRTIPLPAFCNLTDQLLKSGAPIDEINVVRRSLTRLAGGRLAELASPAEVITLAISDVVGDDPATIASGPTVRSSSTNQDARRVLEARMLWHGAEDVIKEVLLEADRPPQPMKGVRFRVLGSNRIALDAAASHAAARGYRVLKHAVPLTGEARDAGCLVAKAAREAGPGTCLLWGGETTVTVRGSGMGGRNQELALAAGISLMNSDSDAVILSAGTDGRDGPTDAAGAWVTARGMQDAMLLGLNPHAHLAENDSYAFFKKAGGLLKTGPTHTNVMDLQIVVVPHRV